MTTNRFQCFTISITPFAEDGAIDEAGLRRHLRKLGDAGIGVYVGGGGSGEGYTLTQQETDRLLRIAVEELKGRVPVRAMGVEPRTAGQMNAFLDMAEAAGVDAAQVYSLDVGHGHMPTPRELDAYFSEVLSNSRLPAVFSTHQSVGYVIPAQVIIDLFARHDHLIGLNVSHQDPGYLRTLVDALGDRIDICVGGPHQAPLALALGGHGFLTSEGNIAPKLCMSVIAAAKAGDNVAFLERWGKLMRLFMALYGNGGIRVTKALLGLYGLAGGVPRAPRLPAEADALARAKAVVEELGIADIEGW
ncbi:dihydrodipicolinate synthase family protein [Sphingomonas jatrophae]|uniref:4-hydroxy-tetrahydrodipicolinate synthase n=1 Tax=Sphingomonas jatrophae TaxID=1166337 RepID=A0A1I6M4R5_9SPHN|nr:dihydrodipicolinate synthase family protein [Sphingomonas jatrophae]SFS10705.1 4-hydroxy-tetrahydrodipicolinate synthase [Sphingomonas jatrophae]